MSMYMSRHLVVRFLNVTSIMKQRRLHWPIWRNFDFYRIIQKGNRERQKQKGVSDAEK